MTCSRTLRGADFFLVDLLLNETSWLLRLSYILMLQMEHNRLHAIRVTIISDAPEEKNHKLKEQYVIEKCQYRYEYIHYLDFRSKTHP